MITLVSTTIGDGTGYIPWTKVLNPEEDHIVIVGDRKTPHARVQNAIRKHWDGMFDYMHPDFKTDFRTEESVGYNCIQRRNVGFLRAMQLKNDYILTVDDDNFPVSPAWRVTALMVLDGKRNSPTISTANGWWNPGSLCHPPVVHRGYPLDRRHEETLPPMAQTIHNQAIGVFASLWTGDPDIDAVERIVNNPTVQQINGSRIAGLGTWAPFNSQATMFKKKYVPTMLMLPDIGRYDDIWASYITRVLMDRDGEAVFYGYPIVNQERNEHDLLKDLDAEVFGMKHTPKFVQTLREIAGQLPGIKGTRDEEISFIWDSIVDEWERDLPWTTIDAIQDWQADLEALRVSAA